MPERGEPMRTEADLRTQAVDDETDPGIASEIHEATQGAAARPIGVTAIPTPGGDGSAPRLEVSGGPAERSTSPAVPIGEPVFEVRDFSAYYGEFRAIRDIDIDIPRNRITAFIGPSGCGKSTMLRCFNRMNDLIPGARMEGTILFDGRAISGPNTDSVALRRRIGMVFQKPNPFPKSVYQNVAWGAHINGYRGDMD